MKRRIANWIINPPPVRWRVREIQLEAFNLGLDSRLVDGIAARDLRQAGFALGVQVGKDLAFRDSRGL